MCEGLRVRQGTMEDPDASAGAKPDGGLLDVLARKAREASEDGDGGAREAALLRELQELQSSLRRGHAEGRRSGAGAAASRTSSSSTFASSGSGDSEGEGEEALVVDSREDVEIVLRYFENTTIVGDGLRRRYAARMCVCARVCLFVCVCVCAL